MSDPRPPIPAELRRAVLVEAGHRCAIPTCKFPTTEIAHIESWARTRIHEFANLIALCPNCHTRHHKGEIDAKSLYAYKANLALLSSRYGEFERRILDRFVRSREQVVRVTADMEMLVWYLLADGIIRALPQEGSVFIMGQAVHPINYVLTPRGLALIDHLRSAKNLDDRAA